jgi:hypothetical protein
LKRAAVVVALALLFPALGHAHGGLPVSQRILRIAGGDTMYVPVVYWGVWVGPAGGPWHWICEEMINGNQFRKFTLSVDGTFYATDKKGVTRSTDSGCTWTAVTGPLATLHTTDIAVDPLADPASAWAATGDGGLITDDGGVITAANSVYVTHDHGDSWAPLNVLPTDRIYTSVRVADAGQTLYVTSGSQSTPFTPTLHRSTNGGTSFLATPLPNTVDGVDPHTLELLTVDPRASTVLWARAVATVPTGSTSVIRQALLRSTDGGTTFAQIYELDATTDPSGQTHGIDSVAIDVSANRVYVATRTGLLSGADDAGNTPPTLAPAGSFSQAQCVDIHGGALYVCTSQFPPDNAAIARSTDGAATYSSVLNYADTVGPVDYCPRGTPVGDMCPYYWYMYGSQLGITFDGGTDGAMMDPPGGGGCGCTVGTVESAAGGLTFAALVLVLAIRTGATSAARARRRG